MEEIRLIHEESGFSPLEAKTAIAMLDFVLRNSARNNITG